MAHIFITGSADGLGRAAAKTLLDQGHQVVIHARSQKRLEAVRELIEQGATPVTGDLADLDQTKDLAEQVNRLGHLDAIIHNAGIYTGKSIMPVNVVAPYVLTALIQRPKRIVYLSSGMHSSGHAQLNGIDWRGLKQSASYSDSKLFVTALSFAVARLWSDVISSAVNPGWVPTKMGGAGAPDDLRLGHLTQEWLVTSNDSKAMVSGKYWFHQQTQKPHASALDAAFQNELLSALEAVTEIKFPK